MSRPKSSGESLFHGRRLVAGVVPRRTPAHWFRWSLLHALILGVLLAAFWRFPYKSSSLMSAPVSQALAAPGSGFTIGALRWDLRAYATDPHLEPLRAYFRSVCGKQSGAAAAVAISKDFVKRYPFGQAPRECFSRSYDPVEDLQEHLRGAPGHCVTRSSLAAAVLLSSGIPARMVQLNTETELGHNVFEVWDRHDNWVLVDPTYGGLLSMDGYLCSAVEAQRYGEKAKWTQAIPPASTANSGDRLYSSHGQDLLRHPVVYPEPWLYMRTGPRASSWPIRGAFAVIGPTWGLGPAQVAFRLAIALFALLAATCFSLGMLLHATRGKQLGAATGAVPEPAQIS